MNKQKWKSKVIEIVSIVALLILAAIYILLMGDRISIRMLETILNQTIITAVVATGAVFIYTTGAFDIALGSAVAVSAITGAFAYNKWESVWIMLLVMVATGVAIELFDSVLAAFLNLPVFVTTIAMFSVLGALVKILIASGGGAKIEVPREAVRVYDNLWMKLVILVLFIGFCIIMYNYTPLGRREKFVGGNPVCARLTGISVKKLSIIAFAIAGIGVGLSAFLTVVKAPTITTSTASSVGMDVIIAIVFGGMPASGGSRSKISAALIGSVSMVLLSQIMTILNLSAGASQCVKAILFLGVVTLSGLKGRKAMLTR